MLRHTLNAEGQIALRISGAKVELVNLMSPADLPSVLEFIDACDRSLRLSIDVPAS